MTDWLAPGKYVSKSLSSGPASSLTPAMLLAGSSMNWMNAARTAALPAEQTEGVSYRDIAIHKVRMKQWLHTDNAVAGREKWYAETVQFD